MSVIKFDAEDEKLLLLPYLISATSISGNVCCFIQLETLLSSS